MARYSRKAVEAFKAERARHNAYWLQELEYSFRYTFSWTQRILKGAYRRNYK